jgi:hypothetical protein
MGILCFTSFPVEKADSREMLKRPRAGKKDILLPRLRTP